jgi:hypothetical protein
MNILSDRRNQMMRRAAVEMGTDRMCELQYLLDEKYVLLLLFSRDCIRLLITFSYRIFAMDYISLYKSSFPQTLSYSNQTSTTVPIPKASLYQCPPHPSRSLAPFVYIRYPLCTPESQAWYGCGMTFEALMHDSADIVG